MSNTLRNTVQYELYIHVDGANPNGDPSNGGRPRLLNDGRGVISEVCMKKKIRKAASMIVKVCGEKYDPDNFNIFDDERDGLTKVEKTENAYEGVEKSQKKGKDDNKNQEVWPVMRDRFWDLRVFGHLGNAFKGTAERVCCGMSVPPGFSVDTVEDKMTDIAFTSSVPYDKKEAKSRGDETVEDGEPKKKERGRGGTLTIVSNSLYKFLISLSPVGCEMNGVSDLDLELFERALCNPFIDDLSNTRPSGTMRVAKLYKISHPNPFRTAIDMTSASLGEDGKTYVYSIDHDLIEKRGCVFEEIDLFQDY